MTDQKYVRVSLVCPLALTLTSLHAPWQPSAVRNEMTARKCKSFKLGFQKKHFHCSSGVRVGLPGV